MLSHNRCPECGQTASKPRNPLPTVDVVIHHQTLGVVLVKRRNYPQGWALPGGFIDRGETAEQAAVREAKEETGLTVRLTRLLGVYSHPDRDPRHHTMSVVFVGETDFPEELAGGDDASRAEFVQLGQWEHLAFDHDTILRDFLETLEGAASQAPLRRGVSLCGTGR